MTSDAVAWNCRAFCQIIHPQGDGHGHHRSPPTSATACSCSAWLNCSKNALGGVPDVSLLGKSTHLCTLVTRVFWCVRTDRCFSLKQRKRKLLKCTSWFRHPVCVTIATCRLLDVHCQQLTAACWKSDPGHRCAWHFSMTSTSQQQIYFTASRLCGNVSLERQNIWGKNASSFLITSEWPPQEGEKSTLYFTHNSRNHLCDIIKRAYTSPGFVTTHPVRSLFQSTRLPCLYLIPNMWTAQQSRKLTGPQGWMSFFFG